MMFIFLIYNTSNTFTEPGNERERERERDNENGLSCVYSQKNHQFPSSYVISEREKERESTVDIFSPLLCPLFFVIINV